MTSEAGFAILGGDWLIGWAMQWNRQAFIWRNSVLLWILLSFRPLRIFHFYLFTFTYIHFFFSLPHSHSHSHTHTHTPPSLAPSLPPSLPPELSFSPLYPSPWMGCMTQITHPMVHGLMGVMCQSKMNLS